MDTLQLLVDKHRPNHRQGPGDDAETMRAPSLAGLDRSRRFKVADIGCGTGASSFVLARELDCAITAVDFLPHFLEELQIRAKGLGLAERITTLACSMDDLPFVENEFDVIISEGAIYNMGFEAGVSYWRRFLKPGGALIVSEITWLTAERPEEIDSYWKRQYAEIDLASSKMAVLERNGYSPIGYFVLPSSCWLENYYRPLQNRHADFLASHGNSDEARQIVADDEEEIRMYETFGAYYGYGMYVAK